MLRHPKLSAVSFQKSVLTQRRTAQTAVPTQRWARAGADKMITAAQRRPSTSVELATRRAKPELVARRTKPRHVQIPPTDSRKERRSESESRSWDERGEPPPTQKRARSKDQETRSVVLLRRKDSRVRKPNPPRAPQVRRNDAVAQRREDDVTPGEPIGSSGEVGNHEQMKNQRSPVPRQVRPQMASREALPCKPHPRAINPREGESPIERQRDPPSEARARESTSPDSGREREPPRQKRAFKRVRVQIPVERESPRQSMRSKGPSPKSGS